MRVIPQEGGRAWLQCGDIPLCNCESIEKAEILGEMLIEGINAREELAEIKHTFKLEDLDRSLEMFEIHLLTQALGLANYNNSKAARSLGVKRTSLIEKMKRYGICKENRFESEENNGRSTASWPVSTRSTHSGEGVPGSACSGLDPLALSRDQDAGELSKSAATVVFTKMEGTANRCSK